MTCQERVLPYSDTPDIQWVLEPGQPFSEEMVLPTQRLYYTDSYLCCFTARVIALAYLHGYPAVALDRSSFYPTSGGQPADRGTINRVPVLDVQVHNDQVWHLLDPNSDSPLPQLHAIVQGEIDWQRRFDHMQQHSGSHLLAAAFRATAGLQAISFHLGAQTSTIDVNTPDLSITQVQAAEDLVHQIIRENRPIMACFVTPAELAALPVTPDLGITSPIRVVSVPDFDISLCGGTHPASTGSVGMIAVQGWTRKKGGTRIEFVCGERVRHDYRRIHTIVNHAAAALSVGVDQLTEALARLRATGDTHRKELERLREQLLEVEARHMLETAVMVGSVRVVCRAVDGKTGKELRSLALHIAAQPGTVALLGTATDRANLVVAGAPELGLDAQAILRAALSLVAGSGGGNTALAQGGAAPERLNEALDAMRLAVISHLASH